MISHDLKQNRSQCQILSFIQSYLPSDFAYCVKFADFYDFQLRTYERNRSCFIKFSLKITNILYFYTETYIYSFYVFSLVHIKSLIHKSG